MLCSPGLGGAVARVAQWLNGRASDLHRSIGVAGSRHGRDAAAQQP